MEAWEEKVWERVFSRNHPPLKEMLREAIFLAESFRYLASGGSRVFMKLYREEAEEVKLLKGLMVLSGEYPPRMGFDGGASLPRRKKIRECCRRCRGLLGSFEACPEGEAAPVFRKLAQMERSHLLTLTRLLGQEH